MLKKLQNQTNKCWHWAAAMLYYEPPPQKTFRTKKKFEKNQNFLLTKRLRGGKVIKLSPKRQRRVPCKLNNVRTQNGNILQLMQISTRKGFLSVEKTQWIFFWELVSNLKIKVISASSCYDTIYREFDPGSGWTLAACLTHASRTKHWRTEIRQSSSLTEWRTGE